MKKQASLVMIRMWSTNYNERTKEVLSWDIRRLTQFITHEMEPYVSKQIFLVQRVLWRYGEKESRTIGEYIRNQLKEIIQQNNLELKLEESFIEKYKLVLVASHASALMHRSDLRAMPKTEKPPTKLGNIHCFTRLSFCNR